MPGKDIRFHSALDSRVRVQEAVRRGGLWRYGVISRVGVLIRIEEWAEVTILNCHSCSV